MTDKRISVIIPVYNGVDTIGRCLTSVFNTGFSDFECIVVDDHSTDKTPDRITAFDVQYIRLNQQRGAAHARNRGAEVARGDVLLFIDSDVEMHPDCFNNVMESFNRYPEASAVFGSYDDQPAQANFLSQYKNLFHHFIHQTSQEEGSTFFTACGAIKRTIFLEIGKFDEQCRMMEDVELGYRLKARGHRIRLIKDLWVKHLKRYSFGSLLKSDFFDRAIPWTVLMLRDKHRTTDLNLKPTHKLSALAVMGVIIALSFSLISRWSLFSIPFLLAAFFAMNFDFYRFFFRKRGTLFTLKVIPFHFLYYLYSSLGFAIGFCQYHLRK